MIAEEPADEARDLQDEWLTSLLQRPVLVPAQHRVELPRRLAQGNRNYRRDRFGDFLHSPMATRAS